MRLVNCARNSDMYELLDAGSGLAQAHFDEIAIASRACSEALKSEFQFRRRGLPPFRKVGEIRWLRKLRATV
jgi:hypothetical protein